MKLPWTPMGQHQIRAWLIPDPVTGLCAEGRHEECSGRVYAGHTKTSGLDGLYRVEAAYRQCRCPCHT